MSVSVAKRGQWGSWCDFLMSIIGCLVGLGNIWRFPYLCYANGGGAFLIPYFFFLVICAVPLVFLETAYSQFANLGPGKVWRICPLFQGIGVGMITLTGVISVYYNVIISWAMFYLAMSFRSVLPWSSCDNEWNTPSCVLRVTGNNSSLNYHNLSTIPLQKFARLGQNVTNTTAGNVSNKTPTEEFWENRVLDITDGIEELGTIRWELLACLFVAWFLVFLCLVKGIKSFGKVAYVTSMMPYVFLLILLIRGSTLPGAMDGVKYYIVPRWEKLLSIKVWGDAAVQTFYSIGLAWGGISTLASYNKFHNNCYRDALILPVLDGLTSWFAGFVIFVVLGFMSHISQVPIDKVVAQGPGIAFMVYPEALAQMPIAPMWSVFFFLMLTMVGLDSQFVHVETIVSAVVDGFPKLRKRQTLVTGLTCLLFFVLGIPFVLKGGVYILQVIDWYCASISVMILAFLEVTVLAYIYGVDRLYSDVELMIGYKPTFIWKIFWLVVTPGSTIFIWMFSLSSHIPVKYGDYKYPGWAISLGWVIGICSLVPIPIYIVTELYLADGSLWDRVKQKCVPSTKWCPADETVSELYEEHTRNRQGIFFGCFQLCTSTKKQNLLYSSGLK